MVLHPGMTVFKQIKLHNKYNNQQKHINKHILNVEAENICSTIIYGYSFNDRVPFP